MVLVYVPGYEMRYEFQSVVLGIMFCKIRHFKFPMIWCSHEVGEEQLYCKAGG